METPQNYYKGNGPMTALERTPRNFGALPQRYRRAMRSSCKAC